MKILIVTQYFWPETFKINDLARELHDRGHEVTVLTGLPNYPQGSIYKGYSFLGPYKEDWDGIKVIRVPLVPRGKGIGYKLVLNYISFPITASILLPFIIRGKIDKVFTYQLSPFFASIPAVFASWFKKAAAVIWVTDIWPESLVVTNTIKNKWALSLVKKIVLWVYKNNHKIIVTSKGFIPRIKKMGISEDKMSYVPQWAESFFENMDLSSNTYSDENFPHDKFVILFAGNIGTSQDMPTVLKAAEILKEREDIAFVFLGDGTHKAWAEGEAKKRNLDSVYFLGKKPMETMPYYYSKSGALLVSLVSNDLFSVTLPTKIQSYMASGKPVLASLDGEGGRVIAENGAGLAVPASCPEKLADAVLKLSQMSKEDLKAMGAKANKAYRKEFLRKDVITKIENHFESLTY
ncbi:hypothetical protein A9Q84_05160 [Halobacteriovorax marinus]|uniref:Glycosyltransferase WbuB n=1 Tax=Halobacteriovorax marinus TaxID=97084 RepID=A0A1Y5FF26_9BACT|nr:hypothetical protein A9Q84_05160 [Halobacteriovorax marinus]